MTEETLGFLGLMRRAGALALGAEDAFDAAREHRARLICLAQDAGKNTRDGLFNALEEGKSALLTLPASKGELGRALGVGECAALAVLDTGFALALCKKLGEESLSAQLSERLDREKKRKIKKESRREQSARKQTHKAPPGGAGLSGAAARIAAKGKGRPHHPSAAGQRPRRGESTGSRRRTDRPRATEQRGN